MAVVAVALDGTRVNASDAATGWSKLNSGGGAPAAEAQIAYQNALSVNVKATNTGGAFGGLSYLHGSANDMSTATGTKVLLFLKANISDSFDLASTFGAAVRIGTDSSNYYRYNVAGTGAKRSVFDTWPSQGGYILTGINPNISSWRDGSGVGTPTLTDIRYFAFTGSWNTGAAKSENLAFDSIDIGRGLLLTGGDSTDPDGTFTDFITLDQDTTANRWGVVYEKSGIIYAVGKLTIGSATATVFTDSGTDIVIFPDGYVGPGDLGVLCDIQNASSVVTMAASQIIGRGSITTSDTRPDFVVSGTSGAFTATGTILRNHRNVTFTSVCVVDACDIECLLLTQSSAHIKNSTISTTTTAGNATWVDPTFGTTSGLHDCTFVQAGTGHAIQLTGTTTRNLTGLQFSGYGSTGTTSAALYCSNGSGSMTINVSSGDTPTYYAPGMTITINNNVTVTLTGLIAGSEVRVYDTSDDSAVDGVESSGTSFGFSYTAGENVYIRIFHVDYLPADIEDFDIPSTAASIPVQQVFDRNYKNP